MLGFNNFHASIQGEFVGEIRNSMRRAFNGQLNDKERDARKREEEAAKMFSASWQ